LRIVKWFKISKRISHLSHRLAPALKKPNAHMQDQFSRIMWASCVERGAEIILAAASVENCQAGGRCILARVELG